jgi:hypothetical protein
MSHRHADIRKHQRSLRRSTSEFGEDVEGAAAVLGRGGQVGAHRGEVLGAGEVRMHPETFCLIFTIRMSRSAGLLSNGTRRSVAKRR